MPKVIQLARAAKLPLECLSHVAVILGIFFFFIQQDTAARARRIETAMHFVELENGSTYTEAREALMTPWRQVNMQEFMARRPSDEILSRLKREVTSTVEDATIERVVDFYSSVLSCRTSKLCDRNIVDEFFRANIHGFYCAYDVRLHAIGSRLHRPDYGSHIQQYVGSCG